MAAAAAAEAEVVADVVVAGDTGTAGGATGALGAWDTFGGALTVAAFSSGGITDSAETEVIADDPADGIAEEPPDATNPDAIGADANGAGGANCIATVEGAAGGGGNVGTTSPGGGAATARGSSISSTGRSGRAS